MLNKIKNTVYDTQYTTTIKHGGSPRVDRKSAKLTDKKSWFDRFVWLFVKIRQEDTAVIQDNRQTLLRNKSLEEQLRYLLTIKDEDYNDSMLTPELRKYILAIEKEYVSTLSDYKTHIAPSVREMKINTVNVSGVFGKTYYATSYPSYIDFLWTRDMLWYYAKWDMSRYIYPADDGAIRSMLKRRVTQLRAEINTNIEKWITLDSEIDIEYKDVESIRQKLATREERYFESSFYTTLYAHQEEALREEGKKFEQKISGYGIRIKPANLRMDEAHTSSLPLWLDDLWISRSMVTTSLAWSFPFISNDLIENTWILYGANLHTGSLVIFDRFARKLSNSNSIILATSGAGKSFAVKLEILRYLLLWIDVLVIDPENEYKALANQVWWTYINISINSSQFINPFDLPPQIEDVDYQTWDLLRTQILSLIGLISVLVGWVTPAQEAILDRAIQSTYALKEITMSDDNLTNKTVPTMQDLLNVMEGMEWWEDLAIRLSKYVTGTFWKLFNNKTNIDLNNRLTVFSIRDIEDALKTPAMYNVLNFIWTKVRSVKKKRLLVIDEAWIMMQQNVSANFLYQIVKRSRKYGLWVTTITQDVEDFVNHEYGKPIVANAALQLLLRQSTASIKALESVFGLSEAEKQKLVSAGIGEWLLFAWNQHVAIKILASPSEKDFITTDIA
jgi:conjugal transfer ATP-binding protein TraC